MNIGKNIRRFRKSLGLTQSQLAERLGVTSQAVSKWETAHSAPDISLLPVLAEILRVTIDELMSDRNQS